VRCLPKAVVRIIRKMVGQTLRSKFPTASSTEIYRSRNMVWDLLSLVFGMAFRHKKNAISYTNEIYLATSG
jgi:hypothetical protein